MTEKWRWGLIVGRMEKDERSHRALVRREQRYSAQAERKWQRKREEKADARR